MKFLYVYILYIHKFLYILNATCCKFFYFLPSLKKSSKSSHTSLVISISEIWVSSDSSSAAFTFFLVTFTVFLVVLFFDLIGLNILVFNIVGVLAGET